MVFSCFVKLGVPYQKQQCYDGWIDASLRAICDYAGNPGILRKIPHSISASGYVVGFRADELEFCFPSWNFNNSSQAESDTPCFAYVRVKMIN